jgi:hypothetical protein
LASDVPRGISRRSNGYQRIGADCDVKATDFDAGIGCVVGDLPRFVDERFAKIAAALWEFTYTAWSRRLMSTRKSFW